MLQIIYKLYKYKYIWYNINKVNSIILTIMIDLTSSIISSTIATIALYPIERLKIQMQLNNQQASVLYNINKIIQQNGIKGFYQGLAPLIIGNGLAYGIYFVSYQKLKLILHTDQNSIMSIVKCSGIAGVIGSLATNPFYVLQTRQSKQNKSVLQILKELIIKQGVFGLWKGMLASIILVLNPIIQFVVYEWMKKKLSSNGKNLSSIKIFIIGAISKIIATLFTYPYTLLRTRQQIKKSQKLSLTKIFNDVLEKQGIKGIFKGLTPKLIQTTLNSALLLMIYQKIRNLLMKQFSK